MTFASRGAFAFLLAASLLAIGPSAGAQERPSNRPPRADTTRESAAYPDGDAVHVYRAILDLLYVDGKNRPSVIVLWSEAVSLGGGPCSKCRVVWPHQSAIDTATILDLEQQSLKRPRIIDFRYKIPIVRVSEAVFERLTHDGFGYLAHLPPEKINSSDPFWEGFRRKYPGAWGHVALGKVGFNPQHTEALIRVYQACGQDCRSGETVFLKRAGKLWRVIERVVDDSHVSTISSGTLRYRGPAVAQGERSQMVAIDAAGTPPRSESADGAKVYAAVLDRLYSPQGEKAQIVLAESPAGPAWGVGPHRSSIDSSTIARFDAYGQIRDQRYPRFGYRRPITWMSEAARKRLDRVGVPPEETHLEPAEEGTQPRFWNAFRSRYPAASGYTKLGRVAFNPAHTQALVFTQRYCGPSRINSETWFLARKHEVWNVVERMTPENQCGRPVSPDALAGSIVPPALDPPAVYSGVYVSTFQENIFSPCDVPGIGSGWAIRFTYPRHAAFLTYQPPVGGLAPATHFIRVRGRVSAPGGFGLGFQSRQIVVDSVLSISDTPQPCPSYEDLPRPWIAVAPSGTRIVGATVSEDGTLAAELDAEAIIKVWDVARGSLVQQFPALDTGRLDFSSIAPMALTRDGQLLAAAGPDGVVRVWNPRDGRRVWTLVGTDTVPRLPTSGPRKVALSGGLTFNDSGTLLANTIADKTIVWSMTTGERLGSHDHYLGPRFLFLADSSFIASGDSGLVGIYPRLGAHPIRTIKTQAQRLHVMQRSPDGRWLVVKGHSDTAYLWSIADGLPGPSLAIPGWFPGAVAFSPDGKTVAMSGGTTGLYLWRTKNGLPLRSFQKFPAQVTKAWFTADGRSIVTYASWDTAFHIVHLDAEKSRIGLERKNPEPVQARWGSYLAPAGTRGPPRYLSGFVRDASGKAIVGAEVSIYDGDRPRSARIARATTNAAGRYLVQAVAPRHVILRVARRGFARETKYAHIPTNWLDVDITMRRIDP